MGGMYTDDFSCYHEDLLSGTYDCVDRVVINAYVPMCQSPGGFRTWWRALFGGDDELDQAHMQRFSGRFVRRLEAWCKSEKVPFLRCAAGERKHQVVEPYLPKDKDFAGVFAVIVARAPGPVWDVRRNQAGQITNLQKRKPWPYVNYYHVHLIDPEWGHVTIRMCGYPPFGAQVILNGHEWVERRAYKQSLPVTKEGNCFTSGPDFMTLNEIAMTLCAPHAIGRLAEVCDRWIYSACLCFGLDVEEQRRTGFRYAYSVFQVEYSRNLIFQSGQQLDEVYQKLLDRTRAALDVPTLKTIFGCHHRPRASQKRGHGQPYRSGQPRREEKVLDRPSHDLTVFKLHFGKLTLKLYDKGERVLRCEAIAHNAQDLHCGKVLEQLPVILEKLRIMVIEFLNHIHAAHRSFLDLGRLDALHEPSQRGANRLAGVDLNRQRIRIILQAVLSLSVKPGGFTVADLCEKMKQLSPPETREQCTPRRTAYDLAKIRAKQLVEKVPHSRRYTVPPDMVRLIAALSILREKILKPVLAGAVAGAPGPSPGEIAPIDKHYLNLQAEFARTFHALGLFAA